MNYVPKVGPTRAALLEEAVEAHEAYHNEAWSCDQVIGRHEQPQFYGAVSQSQKDQAWECYCAASKRTEEERRKVQVLAL